jgi:single-stranded DNA-binding protein
MSRFTAAVLPFTPDEMSIDVAFHGTILKTPERRRSQRGNEYLRFTVRSGDPTDATFISVMLFDVDAELAGRLKSGTHVYCEGALKADIWQGAQGGPRVNLTCMARRVVETHQIGERRPKRTTRQAVARQGELTLRGPPIAGDPVPDDDIPF